MSDGEIVMRPCLSTATLLAPTSAVRANARCALGPVDRRWRRSSSRFQSSWAYNQMQPSRPRIITTRVSGSLPSPACRIVAGTTTRFLSSIAYVSVPRNVAIARELHGDPAFPKYYRRSPRFPTAAHDRRWPSRESKKKNRRYEKTSCTGGDVREGGVKEVM